MLNRVTPLHCRLNNDCTLKYLWKLPIQKFTFKLPNVGQPQQLKPMTKSDILCLMMAVQHKIKLFHCWNPRTQTKLDGKLKCSVSLTKRKCSIFKQSLFFAYFITSAIKPKEYFQNIEIGSLASL